MIIVPLIQDVDASDQVKIRDRNVYVFPLRLCVFAVNDLDLDWRN